MLKVRKSTELEIKTFDLQELFPDITEEMKLHIEQNSILKKDILDYVYRDNAGAQFNACRICKVPEDYKPVEEKVEDLEFELETLDEDEPRYKTVKRELYKNRKLLEKLRHPYKYFDDICESYQICPLYNKGLAPQGEICYFEANKVAEATQNYINEFQIDLVTNNVAKEQITQIVLCDLIIYRAVKALAVTNLSMIIERTGEMGTEYSKQKNHLLTIIHEQNKARLKLLESMIGTPEAKKKYKVENNKSMRQAEAEKATAELIQSKESVKKNKMRNLIFNENDNPEDIKFELIDAEEK